MLEQVAMGSILSSSFTTAMAASISISILLLLQLDQLLPPTRWAASIRFQGRGVLQALPRLLGMCSNSNIHNSTTALVVGAAPAVLPLAPSGASGTCNSRSPLAAAPA